MAALRAREGRVAVNAPRDLPSALVAEAKTRPGGWVYKIVGDYGPDDAVPPTAVRGAWKVDDEGQIVGDFLPNPVFEPRADS
jgi:hypothetical protein